MTDWHWLILGMVLIVGEIFVPSFTILWFGLGAIVVGLMSLFLNIDLMTQILIWTIVSTSFAVFWFAMLKPKMADRNNQSLIRETAIGESGWVIKLPTATTNGKLRFSTSILGQDEWEFTCDTNVSLGDRLHIKEITANTLVVTKLD
jgi:membrane protein implicated in regulation of membrane protease activity